MPDKIRIIGVPMDLGASRRGVDMGPSAVRVAGLQSRLKHLGRQVDDIGNVAVAEPEEQHYGDKNAKYLGEISETCKGLAQMVRKTLDEDLFPLVLGGDHSIAVGTAAGAAEHFGERSPPGKVPGMPRASIMGYGPGKLTGLASVKPMVEPRNIVLVGIRELDS